MSKRTQWTAQVKLRDMEQAKEVTELDSEDHYIIENSEEEFSEAIKRKGERENT